jgi:hypothetical protein
MQRGIRQNHASGSAPNAKLGSAGKISKAEIQAYFEGAVNNTPALKANTPLGAITINGEFSHYADPDTDTMWIGFVLGMRCAERVRRSGA